MPHLNFPSRSAFALLMALLMACMPLRAATTVITSSATTTLTGTDVLALKGKNIFEIADGATLVVTRSGQNTRAANGEASVYILGAGGSAVFRPSGATGRVVFRDIIAQGRGAVFYMNNDTRLEITNGLFEENGVYGKHPSAAINAENAASSLVRLTNTVFRRNWGSGSGVMRFSGALEMTGGGFYDNFAFSTWPFPAGNNAANTANGAPGAVETQGAAWQAAFTGVVFDSNRAARARAHSGGGAIAFTTNNNTAATNATFTNVIFTNNWAAGNGGAIFVPQANLVFNMTASGGATSYLWSGNMAGGTGDASSVDPATNNTDAALNTPGFAPQSRAGGFMFKNATTGTTTFNIDAGVTLTIGEAGAADRALDSFATASTLAPLLKTGGGDLILNADSACWAGNTTVGAGRLLLGNPGARLGGHIVVRAGATFGGAGAWVTRGGATGAAIPRNMIVQTGATIQVGNGNPGDKLVLSDTLAASAGVTFNYDLFDGNRSTQLEVGTLVMSGVSTINLNTVASGTFTLATWEKAGLRDFKQFKLTSKAGGQWRPSLNIISGTMLQLIVLPAGEKN